MHRLEIVTYFGAKGCEFTNLGDGDDAGIQLVFQENAQTERQALRAVAESVRVHQLHWITHEGTEWSVDLDELKGLVPSLSGCTWATGRVPVTPVFDVYDNPFGRPMTYNGCVTLDITPQMVQERSEAVRRTKPLEDRTTMERRYQVFVSSTFKDLKTARQRATWALQAMECIPAGMELFPASNESQWSVIKRVIDDCDYYLLILAGRYGSLDKNGLGYTEKEFDYAVQQGKAIISFLYENPEDLPLNKSEQDPESRIKLQAFRQKAQDEKMVQFWTSPEDLASKISPSLFSMFKRQPAEGWVKGRFAVSNDETARLRSRIVELEKRLEEAKSSGTQTASSLPPEALRLLEEAERSPSGRIMMKEFSGEFSVQAGNLIFDDVADRRKVAMYRSAIRKMATAGLIRTITDGLFELTDEGYTYIFDASRVKASEPQYPVLDVEFGELSARKALGKSVVLNNEPHLPSAENIVPVYKPSGFASDVIESNEDYYVDLNRYLFFINTMRPISFTLTNRGNAVAANVKMRISIKSITGLIVISELDVPKEPKRRRDPFPNTRMRGLYSLLSQEPSEVMVESLEDEYVIEVNFNKVQPKATVWASGVVYLGSYESKSFDMSAAIFDDNLPEPVVVPLTCTINAAQMVEITPSLLRGYIVT